MPVPNEALDRDSPTPKNVSIILVVAGILVGVDLINCLKCVKPTLFVDPSFLNVGSVASSGHTNQTKKNGKTPLSLCWTPLTFTSIRGDLQALEMRLKKKHR